MEILAYLRVLEHGQTDGLFKMVTFIYREQHANYFLEGLMKYTFFLMTEQQTM